MYMIRKIRSGKVTEETAFRVAANVKPRRGRRRGATSTRKQDANDRDAVKRLARVLNCNFQPGDLLLQPTYTDTALYALADGLQEGDLEELRRRAEHALSLFLRRLGRELKKQGEVLQAVWLTSDMDGDSGELVRIHHHVVIRGAGFAMEKGVLWLGSKRVDDIWGRGHVDWEPLQHQDDYSQLAAYLIRQVRRRPDGKKYSSTRNLKKPVLVSERIVYNARELRAPKGARIMHRGAYTPGEPQYLRYVEATREGGPSQARRPSSPRRGESQGAEARGDGRGEGMSRKKGAGA